MLTFIRRYGMNIISDMNNGKELRMQVSCHAVTTSWLNAGGVEGWIDWNLCLDERGQSMDASDASQI